MSFHLYPWFRTCLYHNALKLTFLTTLIYLFLIWIGYKNLEQNISWMHKNGQVFNPQIKPDGSIKLYSRDCKSLHISNQNYKSLSTNKTLLIFDSKDCHSQESPRESNIQMEKEWNDISVGYPQYVYTVSGWIQVVDVKNYSPKSLKVFIMPHSHQDPGWRDTYEGYFNTYTKKTLDLIVKHLNENPKLKFIWSEVLYLQKWFSLPDSKTDQLKRLIANGQLEIVTGGWVMTDEAVSYYTSMLDQLMEGHLWLHKQGITANTSWSVDPFGHSPTMTYLLSGAHINHMVIQRVHFAIKRHFAMHKNLEFFWRQAWDTSGSSSVFCHLMPFLLYAIHYSCGPDPHVCCQFDFHSDKCFRGKESVTKITVDDLNIKKLAHDLWEQFQKKATLYRSNVLLVPHGDDFRYSSLSEWTEQFGNLDKLMDYMNNDKNMNIKIHYGTLSDYFRALEMETLGKVTFPSLTGDFFPYNDRDDQYWTGFYSSRPFFKHGNYVLQAKLRITDILFSLLCAEQSDFCKTFCKQHQNIIVEGRQTLGLLHHHDAITGTSTKSVMSDYGNRLHSAIKNLDDLLALLSFNLVLPKFDRVYSLKPDTIFTVEEWQNPTSPPVLRINNIKGKWTVMIINPLTTQWIGPVYFRTSTPSIIKAKDGTIFTSQINPVLSFELQPVAKLFDIVFIVNISALSLQLYEVVEDLESAQYASIAIYGNNIKAESFLSDYKPVYSKREIIEIENTLLGALFSACSGTLQFVGHKSDHSWYKTQLQLMTYGTGSWMNPFKDKSGAYIFMPDGPAQEIESYYPSIIVVKGPVVSTVLTALPGIRHTVSLYNLTGPLGAGLHLDNLVDISNRSWENKELVMRITTDIISPDHSMCVDQNGFQMHRKKWRAKFLIQGNVHPMTSIAFIENERHQRLNLITSDPHGVASHSPDSIEVILDRRLMQDDWRGLNEGPRDSHINPSKLILLLERGGTRPQTQDPACYPSLLAHLLSTQILNPPQTFLMPGSPEKSQLSLVTEPWPCAYDLVKLRHLSVNGTSTQVLLVLHKAGIDCSYTQLHQHCSVEKEIHINIFKGIRISTAVETTITGVKELDHVKEMKVKIKEMEIKTIKLTFK